MTTIVLRLIATININFVSFEQHSECLAAFAVLAVADLSNRRDPCDWGSSRFCGCFAGEARVAVAAVVVAAAGVVEG